MRLALALVVVLGGCTSQTPSVVPVNGGANPAKCIIKVGESTWLTSRGCRQIGV